MVKYFDYQECVAEQQLLQGEGYNDYLRFALRNYSCWYFAYTLCKNVPESLTDNSVLYDPLQAIQPPLQTEWHYDDLIDPRRLRSVHC